MRKNRYSVHGIRASPSSSCNVGLINKKVLEIYTMVEMPCQWICVDITQYSCGSNACWLHADAGHDDGASCDDGVEPARPQPDLPRRARDLVRRDAAVAAMEPIRVLRRCVGRNSSVRPLV